MLRELCGMHLFELREEAADEGSLAAFDLSHNRVPLRQSSQHEQIIGQAVQTFDVVILTVVERPDLIVIPPCRDVAHHHIVHTRMWVLRGLPFRSQSLVSQHYRLC